MVESGGSFIRDDLDDEEHYRLSLQAYELLRERKNRQARDLLRRIVRLTPTGFEVWFYLGLAEIRLGDKRAARAAFEAALLNKPGDYNTCMLLAWLELRLFCWRALWRHFLCAFKASKAADAAKHDAEAA